MDLKEIFMGGGGVLVVLLTLVQIAPVKVNPWSAIAKAVGRAVNADVAKELCEIKKKLDDHVTMDDRRTADGHRRLMQSIIMEILL